MAQRCDECGALWMTDVELDELEARVTPREDRLKAQLAAAEEALAAADEMRDKGLGLSMLLGVQQLDGDQQLDGETLDAMHSFDNARADYFMRRAAYDKLKQAGK